MRSGNGDPTRWRDSGGDPSALGARAAELARAVGELPPLAPEAVTRIRAGVLARRSSRAGAPLPLGLRFALLATVVLASVATAKGTMILWRRHVEGSAVSAQSARHRGGHARPSVSAEATPPARVPVIEALPPEPAPSPEARPLRVAPPSARRRVAMTAPRSAEDATTEAQLLARALSRLRQGHDPTGALTLLDQYARRFPHGVLESEALSARLEAVIQLDDRKAALALLDHRDGFAGRLGAQLLLTRAELRASAGRYAEALGDFERVLAPRGAAGPNELERALYGRAVSLGRLGRDERARADLTDYQRRFPSGKHAAEVARLLADGAIRP